MEVFDFENTDNNKLLSELLHNKSISFKLKGNTYYDFENDTNLLLKNEFKLSDLNEEDIKCYLFLSMLMLFKVKYEKKEDIDDSDNIIISINI